VKEARVRALTALGEAEANPNARHYYLMSAIELRGTAPAQRRCQAHARKC